MFIFANGTYAVSTPSFTTSPFVCIICFSSVASNLPVISTWVLVALNLVDPPVTSTTVLLALNPNLVSVSFKCSTYCGISISP